MALMMGSVYEALKEAGATDDKAKRAAEEVAGYENRIADLISDVKVLKWMQGVTVAGVVALVVKAFITG